MAQHRVRKKPMSEINVVPYIDVMLVMLVIFMITAPLLTQGVKVDLPEASAEALPPDQDPLQVTVDAEGRFYLNIGDAPLEPLEADVLLQRVETVMRRNRNLKVLVRGDYSVDYGRVVAAMVLLQQAGVANVGLVTDPPR